MRMIEPKETFVVWAHCFSALKVFHLNNLGQDCLFSESDPENSEGSLGTVTLYYVWDLKST